MGLNISACNTPKRLLSNVSDFVRGTKRKLNIRESDDDVNNIIDVAIHSPKRQVDELIYLFFPSRLRFVGKE